MTSNPRTSDNSTRALAHITVDPAHREEALKVVLTEYKALRTEIQNRSSAQSFILQVHITALTFILGAAATTRFFPWLIFLIPIEASIFGLWYMDHAITIAQLGEYIQTCVEPNVNGLVHAKGLLSWESGFYGEKVSLAPKTKPISFETLVFLTFGGPSALALFAGGFNIAFSLPLTRLVVAQGFLGGIPAFYPGASVALAIAALLVGFIMLMVYRRLTKYHQSIVQSRRQSANTPQAHSNELTTIPETLAEVVDASAPSPAGEHTESSQSGSPPER